VHAAPALRGPSRPCGPPVTAAAGRAAVTVDGKVVVMDPDVHEVSSTYSSTDGGQLLLLWQQYRPLLGDTGELTTGAPAPSRPPQAGRVDGARKRVAMPQCPAGRC